MHSITLGRVNSAHFGQKYIKKIHGNSTSTMRLSLSLLSIIICQGIILQVSFLKFLVLPPGPHTPPLYIQSILCGMTVHIHLVHVLIRQLRVHVTKFHSLVLSCNAREKRFNVRSLLLPLVRESECVVARTKKSYYSRLACSCANKKGT